jgi:hypothetical protein
MTSPKIDGCHHWSQTIASDPTVPTARLIVTLKARNADKSVGLRKIATADPGTSKKVAKTRLQRRGPWMSRATTTAAPAANASITIWKFLRK